MKFAIMEIAETDECMIVLHGLITYSAAYTLMHHAPVMPKPDKPGCTLTCRTPSSCFSFNLPPNSPVFSVSHVTKHTVHAHVCTHTRLRHFGLRAADICATIILVHWVDSQLHAGVALHCRIKNSNSGHSEEVTPERWKMNDSVEKHAKSQSS